MVKEAHVASGQIAVINEALGLLGQGPISSLDDGTNAAILAGVFWAGTRDEVIRAHPWNCCTKRVHLSPDTDAPAYGYSKQISLPGDWVRTLEVSTQDYRLERRKLLCNETGIDLRYCFRNEDVPSWDALFTGTVAALLSAKLAYGLTKSISLKDSQLNFYANQLTLARSVDAQEEPSEEIEESSLIAVR